MVAALKLFLGCVLNFCLASYIFVVAIVYASLLLALVAACVLLQTHFTGCFMPGSDTAILQNLMLTVCVIDVFSFIVVREVSRKKGKRGEGGGSRT